MKKRGETGWRWFPSKVPPEKSLDWTGNWPGSRSRQEWLCFGRKTEARWRIWIRRSCRPFNGRVGRPACSPRRCPQARGWCPRSVDPARGIICLATSWVDRLYLSIALSVHCLVVKLWFWAGDNVLLIPPADYFQFSCFMLFVMAINLTFFILHYFSWYCNY